MTVNIELLLCHQDSGVLIVVQRISILMMIMKFPNFHSHVWIATPEQQEKAFQDMLTTGKPFAKIEKFCRLCGKKQQVEVAIGLNQMGNDE